MGIYSVDKLMSEARRLAADYRRATGKTLPLSGEIAVHDAIRLLGLEPAPSEAVGYEAVRRAGDGEQRVQVKGRVIFDERRSGHRLGQIKADKAWDSLVLVLMDEDYEPCEIYEARRTDIMDVVDATRESRRASRGAMSVARFKIIGKRVWTREGGQEDDGYWDNGARP